MLQTSKLMPQGAGLASALIKRASTVELDWDVRQKSRFDCTDSQSRLLGVFLPRGTAVRGGDVLVVEDGSLVRVIAAPQSVLKITHCAAHGSPFDLIRAAYHLGNRHVQIELKPDHLKIEPDHVLADMLRAMHLIVHEVTEAFEPESGAYASHGSHAHAHAHGHHHEHGHNHHDHHGHDHKHDHGHSHSHAPASPAKSKTIPIAAAPALAAQPHVHGPDCNHGHHH
ncbi:MAG: urease accessory protein UreE [Brachymonas sp.]